MNPKSPLTFCCKMVNSIKMAHPPENYQINQSMLTVLCVLCTVGILCVKTNYILGENNTVCGHHVSNFTAKQISTKHL